MAVVGLRGTGDFGVDERPKNFRELILFRNPNGSAPLTALMAKMKKEAVNDPEFSWWEEEHNAVRLQVNGVITTVTHTTVIVDVGDAEDLVIGDLLLVEKTETTSYDNELIEVTSIINTTTFLVSRGAAGSTAAAIANDSFLTRIGNVFEEGAGAPDATTTNPSKYSNFTQIFKTAYRITETAKATNFRTGDPLKNDKIRKMFQHSAVLEFSSLLGRPHEATGGGGKAKRYTGGLLHFLSQAYANGATHCMRIWTTTPTEDEFLDAVYKVWDYETDTGGGNERLVLAGNGFLNSLNKLARDSASTRINFEGTVKVYGMELQKWVLPQGTLYVRTAPLMNTHARFTYSAFVINPSAIRYRPLVGRDTKEMNNIQANDADEQKGQWLTEMGLEFHHLTTMCYLGNFVK